jgi:hypothetical protein
MHISDRLSKRRDAQLTGISRHLMQPLRLLLPVFTLPPPVRYPRLLLVVPCFLITPLGVDAFSMREPFPFGGGFGFG